MRIKFVKSAVELDQCPQDDTPEVGLVGRSNAGKSSFLNALGRSKVAKVSGQPGKTRLLNFFDMDNSKYRIVDMPGYGFAARPHKEREDWRKMVEKYLSERESLRGLLLVMDIRRKWQLEEEQIRAWCQEAGLPLAVVLNKSDKLSRNQQIKARTQMEQSFPYGPIFIASASKKTGVKDVEAFVFQNWVKAEEEVI